MKTVFVSGNFNVIHPGHQRLLKFAKGLGDKLIVGILPDKHIEGTSFIGEKLKQYNINITEKQRELLIHSSVYGSFIISYFLSCF